MPVTRIDRDPAGRPAAYGVLGRHVLADVPAAQVPDVKPLPAG